MLFGIPIGGQGIQSHHVTDCFFSFVVSEIDEYRFLVMGPVMRHQVIFDKIRFVELAPERCFVLVAISITQTNTDALQVILECRLVPAAAVLLPGHRSKLLARNVPLFFMALLPGMLAYQLHAGFGIQFLSFKLALLDTPRVLVMGVARHVFLLLAAKPAIPNQQADAHAPSSCCNQEIAIGLGPRPDPLVFVSQQLHSGIEPPAHQVNAPLCFRYVLGDGCEAFLAAYQQAEFVVVRDGMGGFPFFVLVFRKPLDGACRLAADFVNVDLFGPQILFRAHEIFLFTSLTIQE